MIGEISIAGVFLPPLLLCAGIALVLNILLRRALAAFGFYRFVWHPALFDLALFVIILGGLSALFPVWIVP